MTKNGVYFSNPRAQILLEKKWLITHLNVEGGLVHGFDHRSHE